MAARRPEKVFPFLALALLAGCEEQVLTSTGIVHPTLVEVSPDDFTADVPCLEGPGSMQVYVATLYDHGFPPLDGTGGATGEEDDGSSGAGGAGDGTGPKTRRSGLVSCGTAVGFARVTPDHRYSVDIEAFDRADLIVNPVDDPLDPPPVRDATTNEIVPPRWTTSCGKATARAAVVRRIRNCEPIVDHQPSTATAVELRPELALGSARCGSGPDDVDHFEVTTAAGVQTLACGDPLVLADTTANRTLVVSVLAFAASDAAPLLGATCTAEPRLGVTVTATCAPFTDKGALEIDPTAAAAALGLDCAALRDLTLTAPGAAPLRVRPSACGSLVPFVGLTRGATDVAVVATPVDGAGDVTGTCSAQVIPGQRVLAACAPEP